MNDSPVIEQDGSVAPRSKAEFPSGIRFGLRGSLDGDDMMQRALGSREAAPAQQDAPEDIPRTAAWSPPSSFGFVGFTTVSPGVCYMELHGGSVRYNSKFVVSMAATHAASEDPELAETGIQITGTLAAPTYVCIQMNKVDANVCSFVGLAAEPEDNGTYWYRILHAAYLDDAGTALYLADRRHDWNLGSPIK